MPVSTKEILERHPRADSLKVRHLIQKAFENGLVVPAGLMAHGRGEAFDYLLGEETSKEASEAAKVVSATLLLADLPIISINGNAIALAGNELVRLSKITGAKLEVNLFHRDVEREKSIAKELKRNGAEEVFGVDREYQINIPEIHSSRRIVDQRGIFVADMVLVPLEDGDRTEALGKMGKTVASIDLNPLSRTAQSSTITIVDNIVRAAPLLIKYSEKFKLFSKKELEDIVKNFDNKVNLSSMMNIMLQKVDRVYGES